MSKKTREKSCLKVNSQSGRTEEGDWHAPKNQHFSATGRFERPIFLFGFVARKLPQRTCQLLFFPPQKNPSNFGEGGNSTIAFLKIRQKSKWAPKQAAIFSSLFFSVSMARWIWACPKKRRFFRHGTSLRSSAQKKTETQLVSWNPIKYWLVVLQIPSFFNGLSENLSKWVVESLT